jgi:hypothetical protein
VTDQLLLVPGSDIGGRKSISRVEVVRRHRSPEIEIGDRCMRENITDTNEVLQIDLPLLICQEEVALSEVLVEI